MTVLENGLNILKEGVYLEFRRLNITGSIYIDGELVGDIESSDTVTIGKKGTVKGNIRTKFITIEGKLYGDINSYDAHLKSTSIIKGNVASEFLTIDKGCQINGSYTAISSMDTWSDNIDTIEECQGCD